MRGSGDCLLLIAAHRCSVTARTSHRNVSRVKKTNFPILPETSCSVGSDDDCTLRIRDDPRVEGEHVRLFLADDGRVMLRPQAMAYLLVGQEFQECVPTLFGLDSVLKFGSVSLLVTDVCMSKKPKSGGSSVDEDDASVRSTCSTDVEDGGAGESVVDATAGGGGEGVAPSDELMESKRGEAACSDGDGGEAEAADKDGTKKAAGDEAEAAEEKLCYMCWDGEETLENPLVSPCLCSGSSKFVHQTCLLKWIAMTKSKRCSVCKSRFDRSIFCVPPYIVLKVVRRQRGSRWRGQREFIVSFSGRSSVTLGRTSSCDVHLPDESVSGTHGRLRLEGGKFYLEDNLSTTGTFLRIRDAIPLSFDTHNYVKIGHTLLKLQAHQPDVA
eukprot:PLAT13144.1.p1 GENE.PLAT13144.1~~PLAT13144.1.p1  ORF type:complete len:384 (-),score=107.67 PLAT13144.1:136-1287(-)